MLFRSPWLAVAQPDTHPLRRALLFPALTTALVAETVATIVGRKVGAHALRRSALRTALDAGVPIPAAILLSLHKDTRTALAYAVFPDISTADTMAMVSAATVALPSPAAPLRHHQGN